MGEGQDQEAQSPGLSSEQVLLALEKATGGLPDRTELQPYVELPPLSPTSEPSFTHDKSHSIRTLVLAELLGRICQKKGGAVNQEALRVAAMAHDQLREFEGLETGHGLRAAQMLRGAGQKYLLDLSPKDLETAAFICQYHDLPDSDAPTYNKANWLNLMIFKDADALERVRLGDLDQRQLRFDESGSILLPVAARLYKAFFRSTDKGSLIENMIKPPFEDRILNAAVIMGFLTGEAEMMAGTERMDLVRRFTKEEKVTLMASHSTDLQAAALIGLTKTVLRGEKGLALARTILSTPPKKSPLATDRVHWQALFVHPGYSIRSYPQESGRKGTPRDEVFVAMPLNSLIHLEHEGIPLWTINDLKITKDNDDIMALAKKHGVYSSLRQEELKIKETEWYQHRAIDAGFYYQLMDVYRKLAAEKLPQSAHESFIAASELSIPGDIKIGGCAKLFMPESFRPAFRNELERIYRCLQALPADQKRRVYDPNMMPTITSTLGELAGSLPNEEEFIEKTLAEVVFYDNGFASGTEALMHYSLPENNQGLFDENKKPIVYAGSTTVDRRRKREALRGQRLINDQRELRLVHYSSTDYQQPQVGETRRARVVEEVQQAYQDGRYINVIGHPDDTRQVVDAFVESLPAGTKMIRVSLQPGRTALPEDALANHEVKNKDVIYLMAQQFEASISLEDLPPVSGNQLISEMVQDTVRKGQKLVVILEQVENLASKLTIGSFLGGVRSQLMLRSSRPEMRLASWVITSTVRLNELQRGIANYSHYNEGWTILLNSKDR